MNDIEVSSIDLVEGGNVFKQGHYLTLGYVPRDEKGETVDLSGKTLNVSLWGRKGVVFEAGATYSAGVIRFTFDKLVAAGDYTVEFTATSSTDAKYRKKFPTNQHSGRIVIKQSADDLGAIGISVYTVAQFQQLFDEAVGAVTEDSEVILARDGEALLGARLDKDKQELTRQLAETFRKSETGVLSLDAFTEEDRAIIQGLEPGTINAVLGYKNVLAENAAFFKRGKNMLNHAKSTEGQRLHSSGVGTDAVGYWLSEYIPISAPSHAVDKHSEYAYYKADKTFISLKYAATKVTALPDGGAFMRVAYPDANKNSVQVEEGTVVTSYQPYVEFIPKEFTEKHSLEAGDIPASFTEEIKTGVLSAVEENSFSGVENAMSSWWIYPLSVRYKGIRDKDYHGFTDNEGNSGVISYDHDTKESVRTVLATAEVDDHNAMAVDVMPDGRIIAAYSYGHNSRHTVHIRISRLRENISEFGEEITIDVGQPTSYAQLFHKSGKWFLFVRLANNWWGYVTSTDGVTWSSVRRFLSAGTQYYLKVTETTSTNLLRFTMYSHPVNGTDPNIRQGFFNTSTETVQLLDGSAIAGDNIPHTSFPIIIPVESGKKHRLLDVSITAPSKAVVGYATYSTAANQDYKVGIYESGTLSIKTLATSGIAFYTSSVYVNGLCFGKSDIDVFLSRESNNVWTIEHWKLINGNYAFFKAIDIAPVGIRNIRPNFTKNGNTIKWIKGDYSLLDYTDFYTDFKFKTIV